MLYRVPTHIMINSSGLARLLKIKKENRRLCYEHMFSTEGTGEFVLFFNPLKKSTIRVVVAFIPMKIMIAHRIDNDVIVVKFFLT